MYEAIKVTIEDQGDRSVGINPQYWEVEVPFTEDCDDQKDLSDFCKELYNLYHECCDGRCEITYTWKGRNYTISKRRQVDFKTKKSSYEWQEIDWVHDND